MPANVSLEYSLAERKYKEAGTDIEKLKALTDMLSKAPSHKGGERLRQEIKRKISRLRERIEKSGKKRGKTTGIKKEGAATIVLVGLTNSGKSYILSKLTNAKVDISGYEFTTKKPEVGTMDYNGVKLQVIELPAMFKGYAVSGRGPAYMAIARIADLVLIVLDGEKHLDEQLFLIEEEFRGVFMELGKDVNAAVLVNKAGRRFYCGYNIAHLDSLEDDIWRCLGLIYVYTKTPGKEKDYPPVALEKGCSVRDLAIVVHRDFIKNFRFARIWGRSVKHDGTQTGLDHVLEEGDIIELHMN